MKQKLLNSMKLRATLLVAILCSLFTGTAWGDTSTLNFAAACGGSGTSNDGLEWTVTSDGAESNFDSTSGIHYGTNKASVTYITLTTSNLSTILSGKKITKIVVNARDAQSNATITVSVGSTTFTADTNNPSIANSSDDFTFNGEAAIENSDQVTVDVRRSSSMSKAIYVKSIVITYEDASAPSYTITAQSNDDSYGSVSLSGSVITGTPNSGYRYATPAYTVSPANSATVAQNGNEFTVTPSANTTVTINFEAIPCYTVTLSDDTENPLTEASAGAGVTLPSRSAIGSYTFAGWSTTDVPTETTTAPTSIIPVGTYNPTANITLYPVYSKTEGGGGSVNETASVTISDYASDNSWSSSTKYETVTLDANVTATANGSSNTGKYYTSGGGSWRFYSSESGYMTISVSNGELTSATITFSNATLSYNEENITSGSPVSLSGTSASFYAGGTTYITAISVNYTTTGGGTTYYWSSPVAATVERPEITIAENPFYFNTTATVTCETTGATIYYTTDGNDPTTSSSVYSSAIPLTATTTIKAFAVKDANQSTIASVTATKNLATPTVTVSGDLTLDLNGGTNVNAGTLTAAVIYNEAAVAGATVTWSSSNTDIATIDASGAVTIKTTGSVTFTATYEGNSDYAEATGTKTVTVVDSNTPGTTQQNPYTVAEAIPVIQALPDNNATSDKYYVSGIVSAFYGDATGITSSSSKRYYISDDGTTTTQLLVYSGKGLNNETFSSDDDLLIGDRVIIYGAIQNFQGNTPEIASGNYIVSLQRTKTDPTIVVNSTETVTYGSTFTVDDTMIEGGEITVTSSNTAVATVSGLVITPVAVGTTTITVATAESTSYNEGSETFELTVTQPAGSTTAPTGSVGGTIFQETFNSSTGTNSNFGDSGDAAGTLTTDNSGWSYENNSKNGANGAAKFGAGSKKGGATTPSISATNGTTYTLTFKAAPWAEEETTLSVEAEGATVSGISTDPMSTREWNDFSATVTATSNSFALTFSANNNRFFLDEVTITAPSSPAPAITATLNAYGYATYCSQYPLDFSGATDYSAWQITGISGTTITFAKVTGSVKGGTGLLLMGTASETITLTSADSDNTLDGNKLEGTLAPTYVTAETAYGLSGKTFKKNTDAGTIPAGRAYLPASEVGAGVKSFTFVFQDEATGITETRTATREEVEAIFNLAGQRMNKMQKGINIVNGKKVLVK